MEELSPCVEPEIQLIGVANQVPLMKINNFPGSTVHFQGVIASGGDDTKRIVDLQLENSKLREEIRLLKNQLRRVYEAHGQKGFGL